MLVQFNDVAKSYGARAVLRNVSFQINPSEKIGLIGTNGAGKTTLLKMLLGPLETDAGTITRRSGLRIGSLDQIPTFKEGASVLTEGLQAFPDLLSAEHEMALLEHEISVKHENSLLDRYSDLQDAFDLKGGYKFRAQTEAALLGVGFDRNTLGRPASTLSGGEKNRLALAKLLLSESELLLLDEPTNHLDIRSIEWLERFLRETAKTILVVSHDRVFLDRVATRILEVINCHVQDYRGNYTAYLKERDERLTRQEKEWHQQQEWIDTQEEYIRRNIAGQKTKQAKSRRKMLERVVRIDKPATATTRVKFRFLPIERSSRLVVETRDLVVGYEKPLLRDFSFAVERGSRWAILGANGAGKTTLLKTLVGMLSPLGGELDWSEGTGLGYYDQQLQNLNARATILDELRELDSTVTDGELRSYLAQFLFSGEEVFSQVGTLSGGERSRVALAKLIYQAPTILALDEPTNHLDIPAREALESALSDYPGTILFITHDRYLAQKLATNFLYIEQGKAFVFDRLSALEEWLERPATDSDTLTEPPTLVAPPSGGMSKNRREKLNEEFRTTEDRIEALEVELTALEAAFGDPDPEMNWEAAHRRHAEIGRALEELYSRLEELSELLR